MEGEKEEGEREGTRVYEEECRDTTWEVHAVEEGEIVDNELRGQKCILNVEEEGEMRKEKMLDDGEELERSEECVVFKENMKGAVVHKKEGAKQGQGTMIYQEEQETTGGTLIIVEDETKERMSQDLEVMQWRFEEGIEDFSRDYVICIEQEGHVTMDQIPSLPEWWLRLSNTFLTFLSSGHLVDLWLVCRDSFTVPAHQLLLSHASPSLAVWMSGAIEDTQ